MLFVEEEDELRSPQEALMKGAQRDQAVLSRTFDHGHARSKVKLDEISNFD